MVDVNFFWKVSVKQNKQVIFMLKIDRKFCTNANTLKLGTCYIIVVLLIER